MANDTSSSSSLPTHNVYQKVPISRNAHSPKMFYGQALLDILLLGFLSKFRYRLELYSAEENVGEWRTGQQDEWNRLGTTTSLLVTASAASLAVTGIDHSAWFARAAFSAAFGMSICGYFTVSYLSVLAEGLCDNVVAQVSLKGSSMETQIVAFIMAVPVALSVYPAVFLFFGHCAYLMTVTDNAVANLTGNAVVAFRLIAGVPLAFAFLMMVGGIWLSEAMYRRAREEEVNGREQKARERAREKEEAAKTETASSR